MLKTDRSSLHLQILLLEVLGGYFGGAAESRAADFLQRATTSRYHQHYQQLDPLRPPPYAASLNLSRARWMFKARGGAMYLNYVPWRGKAEQRCAMCNTGEREDVLHFLGACLILKELRWQWFGARLMSSEECSKLMTSSGWLASARWQGGTTGKPGTNGNWYSSLTTRHFGQKEDSLPGRTACLIGRKGKPPVTFFLTFNVLYYLKKKNNKYVPTPGDDRIGQPENRLI
ncbi:unnamed protein product [Nesidiocoris tenuis]|uniref:Reverse transcriptase zinc-binding domain-containing protein n=1 Tax=Nesidiocoris tenuis TaxID=355587 RepID=A0A6H5GQ90_9HEMI|nr:unnamed protein product [Nesidiocoris tenuis]